MTTDMPKEEDQYQVTESGGVDSKKAEERSFDWLKKKYKWVEYPEGSVPVTETNYPDSKIGGVDRRWRELAKERHQIVIAYTKALTVAHAQLAALSLAAMEADLYCWGPGYTPEKSGEAAKRLRQLAQPGPEREEEAWRLLDKLTKAEKRAEELQRTLDEISQGKSESLTLLLVRKDLEDTRTQRDVLQDVMKRARLYLNEARTEDNPEASRRKVDAVLTLISAHVR